LTLSFVEARSESELDAAFDRLAEGRVRVLYLVDDPLLSNPASSTPGRALRGSIAMISTLRNVAESGGLASYGTDFAQLHHDAAIYVARILKGEKPADLPIMLPTKFALTLNLRTAKAIGIEMTQAVLARADEVIE
jgi:putative ABC transport system substrate-binding protein